MASNKIVLVGIESIVLELVKDGSLIAFLAEGKDEVQFCPSSMSEHIPANSEIFEPAAFELVLNEASSSKRDDR